MSEHLGVTSFPQACEHIVELGCVELLCSLLYELYEDAKCNKYNIELFVCQRMLFLMAPSCGVIDWNALKVRSGTFQIGNSHVRLFFLMNAASRHVAKIVFIS